MQLRPSRVLRKLRAGKPAFSTKTNFGDPRIVEIMALAGFDSCWLCNEHVPGNWMNTLAQITAAKAHDMDSLVRVSKGSYSDYIRPLEGDATGIMVPHLMSAQEARDVVRMTKFHPVGRRPVDGGNNDGAFCLIPPAEYMEQANRERFVICQIEDPEPMAELDEIAATPGLDMLFFGPGDFSHALGIPGQYDHPDVVAARREMAAACQRHGIFAGTVGNVEKVPQLLEEGFLFINIGSDVGLLGKGWSQAVEDLKPYGIAD
jgi:4-hydroxy-2-oxoheptanedioate aldolase